MALNKLSIESLDLAGKRVLMRWVVSHPAIFDFNRFFNICQRWLQRANQGRQDHQQPAHCRCHGERQVRPRQGSQVCRKCRCGVIISENYAISNRNGFAKVGWRGLIRNLSFLGSLLALGSSGWQQERKVHNGPSRRRVEEVVGQGRDFP